jgi:predicted amidohydrolase YtcJ
MTRLAPFAKLHERPIQDALPEVEAVVILDGEIVYLGAVEDAVEVMKRGAEIL